MGQNIYSDDNGYAGYSIDSIFGGGNFGEINGDIF
jgi:hypothetical protein